MFISLYISIIHRNKITEQHNLLKNLQNITLKNKASSLIFASLGIIGTFFNPYFILIAALYLCLICTAYYAGSKISGVGMNAAFNWSIKWVLFVVSLFFVGTYVQEAFIVIMFTFILINTTINHSIFFKTQDTTA